MFTIQNSNNVNLQLKDYTSLRQWEPEMLVYEEIDMINKFFENNQIKKVINVQERVNLQYDQKLEMAPRYIGEDIQYASFCDRCSQYQIFVYEGKLYNSKGELVNTDALNFNSGAILVMDLRGNLFLSHKKRGEIHHSTFLAGAPVSYACMLEVKEGVIVEEVIWSVHYLHNSITQRQFHYRLKKNFAESYQQDLTAIFLTHTSSSNFLSKSISQCYFSNKPLINAVKLPCGHKFDQESIKKYSACPRDNKSFEWHDVTFDIEENIKTLKNYTEPYTKIRLLSEEMEQKVINLKLDDWSNRNFKVVGKKDRAGVYLFLKSDSTLNKIVEIIKALGLASNVQGFYVQGRAFYLGQFDRNLQSLPFDQETRMIHFY